MNDLKQYDIVFTGLKLGEHQFDYQVDETFFNEYLAEKINKASVDVQLQLDKRENMLELEISAQGKMTFPCDRCLDDNEIDVAVSKEKIYVKFGEEEQELAEDLIILRNDDYKINIADTLYELIMVSLPMKKVHQNSDDCNSEVVEKINIEEQKNEETDPRWAALNKLKK
ncbi:MAG TPA: hypothetical protein DIU39_07320 [Flavobacteriales bacterium]|nr:hypothetical protein [Flavobacteriales bacterium]|tara:strand:+ start:9395 stop:9904 length:510 start_codon:yes stop_codon:yes gene_type:complete